MRNPTYDPGELDQVIQVLREVKAPDGLGGSITVETVVFPNVRAKIKPANPNERHQFDQTQVVETAIFVLRYREDILATDVIEWRGRRFNIRGLPSVNYRSRFIEIPAERGVGQ